MADDEDETLDVQPAAEQLAAAALAHARSIDSGSPQARQEAGRALVEAMDAYGVAVASSGAEVPEDLAEFQDWFDEEDGMERPEADPDQRVSLFTRTDLFVQDLDLLQATAATRLASCCGEVTDDVGGAVANPADAVGHLVGHEPTSLDADDVEQYGLRLLSWTSVAISGLPEYDDDPWAPLRDGPADEG